MAKLRDVYYQAPKHFHSTIPVYHKRGIIAKLARWIHNRFPSKRLFNLGWGLHEININQPIGTVIGFSEDGNPIVRIGGQDE